jgi:predicted nuclease of predicted toxin-antitoxin system
VPEPIRFHLDEHMDPDIAAGLRRYDIDVTTTAERALTGHSDIAHLSMARTEHRVIVTDDTDFLAAAEADSNHAGIAFCRRKDYSTGEILRFLILLHGVYDAEDMRGRVEFVFRVS